MLTTGATIAYRGGTYRTASPEQTWRRIEPILPQLMITRVADVTHLDEIGLPVHVAYRPVGSTLAVSIGAGRSANDEIGRRGHAVSVAPASPSPRLGSGRA